MPKSIATRATSISSPIVKHYRPLSPHFRPVEVERLKVVSTDAVLNGIRCILLEERPDGFRVGKYWVAPDRAMGIIRYERSFQGVPEVQADVTFKRDGKHGWVPNRWSAALFAGTDGDKCLSSCESAVVEFELNPTIAAQNFELDFPPGTLVSDNTAQRMFTVPPAASDR